MKEEKLSKQLRKQTLQINTALIDSGYNTECYYEGCYEVVGHNDLFHIRVIPEEYIVHIGIKKTFDRWANSIDAYFEIPKTVEKFKAKLVEFTQNLIK